MSKLFMRPRILDIKIVKSRKLRTCDCCFDFINKEQEYHKLRVTYNGIVVFCLCYDCVRNGLNSTQLWHMSMGD